MAIQNNFPNLTPTLLLDFANAGKLDPRVTFSRATTATYFNSLGVLTTAGNNVARFDYDPYTLAPLGLLIEEQRTNSFLQNFDISNASWIKVRATTPGTTTTSPSGGTAQKLVEDTTPAETHFFRQDMSVTSGATYTQSVYAKAAERTQIQMSFDVDAGAFTDGAVIFTLTGNGSATVIAGSPSFSITSVGNGWYRCTISQSAAATATAVFRIRLASGGTSFYNGNGTSGLFFWGAQIEQGAFATSVIPTTTTALTRNADVASMTGTNFSSWYNAAEGTLYYEGMVQVNNDGIVYTGIGDTFDNTAYFVRAAPNQAWIVRSGASVQAEINVNFTPTANVPFKMVGTLKVNDFAFCVNGGTVATDVSGVLPASAVRLGIGNSPWTPSGGNGRQQWIRSIRYYPVRVTNAQLQALTG
jgi:hypothetical protein